MTRIFLWPARPASGRIRCREVADWLQELREELWDRQIDADIKAGRLDKLAEEALEDYRAGRVKPLDEIMNQS